VKKTILSTADVARLFNVTETTVKRWADGGTLKCQKTPGGHRKYEVKNVVEFAEKNNFDPVGTLAMPGDDAYGPALQVAVLERAFPALVRIYVEKALTSGRADLYNLFSFLYEHKIHLWELCDLIIRPGMIEIGERWVRGELGVNHEHRASYETLDALSKLHSNILRKPSNGRTALFSCLGEETHEIGLRCAFYLFESEGWITHYLGARMPLTAMVSAVREVRPHVVCISATGNDNSDTLRALLKETNAVVCEVGGKLLVGGRGASPEFVQMNLCSALFSSAEDVHHFLTRGEKW